MRDNCLTKSLNHIAIIVILMSLSHPLHHNEADSFFFQYLNSLHYSLQFMIEVENNNMDVLVERTPTSFLTSVYGKPIFTRLYLSWESFAPLSRKINLVKTLTHRALMI